MNDAGEAQPRRITVNLGERSYDIVIGPGLIDAAGGFIASAAPGARCAIVTDANVARLHLPKLEAALGAARLLAGPSLALEPGEGTKSFAHLARVCDHLLDLRLERGDAVIAFGGGVIGDLAAFAAAILKRGVKLIQIPTTLLAQVDSSVGGKTGINTAHGKNLIGAFYQPSLVLADIDALGTLEPREFRAGYAEVAKYGLFGDAPFFSWLEANRGAVFSGEGEARAEAIERSCRAKAAIVEEDEREAGRRALLNLGHSFGHALEAWAGYSGALIHGEAVSIGMVLAFEFSERLGVCAIGENTRAANHLRAAGLPVSLGDLARLTNRAPPSAGELTRLMEQDKKVSGGRLALILARRIGEAFVSRDADAAQIEAFLAERLSY